MLMSYYGVELSLKDILKETDITWVTEFDEEDRSFSCSYLAAQNVKYYNPLLKFLPGFSFKEEHITDPEQYAETICRLLSSGNPIMTGISKSLLPYMSERQDVTGRHAVVLTNLCVDSVIISDPDGGLDRSQEYLFDEVKDRVVYAVSLNDLKKFFAMDPFASLLFLERKNYQRQIDRTFIQTKLKDSILIAEKYPEIIANEMKHLTMISERIYEQFHSFTYRLIKPFVQELLSSLQIETIEEDLQKLLQDIKIQTFYFMKEVKEKQTISKQINDYYIDKSLIIIDTIIDNIKRRL